MAGGDAKAANVVRGDVEATMAMGSNTAEAACAMAQVAMWRPWWHVGHPRRCTRPFIDRLGRI